MHERESVESFILGASARSGRVRSVGTSRLLERIPEFLDSQIFRYFVFGSVAAAVHLSVLALLVELGRLDATLASGLAFCVGLLANYILQSRYTFRSAEPHLTALPKFASSALLGVMLNLLIFTMLDRLMHYLIAQAIAILVVFYFNYTVSRILIFRRRR